MFLKVYLGNLYLVNILKRLIITIVLWLRVFGEKLTRIAHGMNVEIRPKPGFVRQCFTNYGLAQRSNPREFLIQTSVAAVSEDISLARRDCWYGLRYLQWLPEVFEHLHYFYSVCSRKNPKMVWNILREPAMHLLKAETVQWKERVWFCKATRGRRGRKI